MPIWKEILKHSQKAHTYRRVRETWGCFAHRNVFDPNSPFFAAFFSVTRIRIISFAFMTFFLHSQQKQLNAPIAAGKAHEQREQLQLEGMPKRNAEMQQCHQEHVKSAKKYCILCGVGRCSRVASNYPQALEGQSCSSATGASAR